MRGKFLTLAVVLIGTMFFLFASASAQWTEQVSGTSVNLISISAPTYQVAWVAGPAGTVKRTINNGTTWVDKSIPTAGDLYCIYAFNANTALVTGYAPDWSDHIWKTIDGGNTWNNISNGGCWYDSDRRWIIYFILWRHI